MKYYCLHINCSPNKVIYDKITEILGVAPKAFQPSKLFPVQTYDSWMYQIVEHDEEPTIDFINVFLDLIEPNLEKLKELGISKNDILIWLNYEYQHQCAMEFHPQEMKRLGEFGIHLNIDCWENQEET